MPSNHDPLTLAWYADPDFVNARNHVIPSGGVSAYIETPPQSNVAGDVTGFIYGQAEWSNRHMPNILYRLRSGDDWLIFRRSARMPPQKRDSQGQPKFEEWPSSPGTAQELLDFEILPDRIGSREHWWRLEAWRRLDPRIRWQDITMRMSPNDKPSVSNVRSRVSRPRVSFSVLSWFEAPSAEHKTNDAVLAKLSDAQKLNNTTRGSTPGLIDPALGRAGGRVYLKNEGPGDDTPTHSSQSAGSASDSTNEDAVEEAVVASEAGDDVPNEEPGGEDVAPEEGGDVRNEAVVISDDEDGHVANREHNEDEDPFFISDNEDEHVKNGEVDEDLARFLPVDSRDFDSDGQYIVGEVEWQLEQAVRAREESRRDDERQSERPYGWW